MIKSLNTAIGGTPLSFMNNKRLPPVNSTRKVYFRCHVTEAEPASRRRSSHYEVLRVKSNATPNEIKTAYRNLAKIYHPDALDLDQHDDRKFIEIHNAYVTLYDPDERLMYDLKLNTGVGRRSESYTAAGNRRGFYTSRRWETDQCW